MRQLIISAILLSFCLQAKDLGKFIQTDLYQKTPAEIIKEFPGSRWGSAVKKKLYLPKGVSFQKEPIHEGIATFKDGKLSKLDLYFYNRGDQGSKSKEKFKKLYNRVALNTASLLGTKGKQKGRTRKVSFSWKNKLSKFKLLASSSSKPYRAEFLVLKVSSSAKKTTKTADTKTLIERKENGDVFLKGVPMVDQGQKGYCVAASISRVIQFYGRDLGMHEVAKLANTTNDGTSISDAIQAVKRSRGKLKINCKNIRFRSKTISMAKKLFPAAKNAPEIPFNQYLYARYVLSSSDRSTLLQAIEKKKNLSKGFLKLIKKSINKGYPIAWTMTYGVYSEGKRPLMQGAASGHMRLIIGYNESKQEIIFSDSWGRGHEFKKCSIAQAYAITSSLFEISPW